MNYFNDLSKEYQKELLELIKEELRHNCLKSDTISEKYFCVSDIHQKLFNEDHYFIYTYDCIQFIESEFNSAFEAIEIVKDWEESNLGTFNTSIDAFSIANMLIYIIGEDLIYNVLNIDDDNKVEEILNKIEELIQ